MAKIGKLMKLLMVLLFWMGASHASAGSLTGELDKAEGTVEDQFVYTLAVQGSADGEPKFPDIPDIQIQKAGTSQSVSIINGKMSREVQYQFVLTASKEGTYTIPAIAMTIDDKAQQTLPIEFKVKPAGSGTGSLKERPLFIERSLSKQKVYVGESLVSSIRVFSRVRILAAEPDFRYPDGMQVKKIDGEKSYSKVLDGQEFAVNQFDAILVPNKEGKFEVPGAALGVRYIDQSKPRRSAGSLLDDLWGQGNTAEKRITSPSLTVEVLPLPLTGRRADFSGLVGEFTGRAEVSSRSVKAGETVTVNVVIEGRGATGGMAEPEFDLGDKAKVYKDKPQSQDSYDAAQGVLGQRTFKVAVVPTQSGELDIGTLKIQYFNTASGHYQDLTVDVGKIQVMANGAVKSAPPVTPADAQSFAPPPAAPNPGVKALADDLLEPHSPDRLAKQDELQTADLMGGAGLLFCSLILTGFSGWKSYLRLQGGRRDVRKKADRALKLAQGQMKDARRLLESQDVKSAVGQAQKIIRQYVGDRFGIKSGGLTLRDLEQQLAQQGLSTDTISDMRRVWQDLDQLLFAEASADQNRSREVLQKVDKLLQEVEERCAH